jgi:hypothetical protein
MVGTGFQEIMFNRTVCTGDNAAVNDGLEGFPSGHTAAVFAGFVFLSLYLNAKLKIFANYRPSFVPPFMWLIIDTGRLCHFLHLCWAQPSSPDTWSRIIITVRMMLLREELLVRQLDTRISGQVISVSGIIE